jgi:Holliday junction resolvasome RuvABC endonuclease subunit
VSVLGLDVSLTGTGLAYSEGRWPLAGTVSTTAAELDGVRLDRIYLAVRVVIKRRATAGAPILLAVIEDLPTHAHSAGLTGMAQGVVRLALHHAGTPMLEVTAATLKKYATGKGNASKADMRMALYRRTNLDLPDDNQVDAMWLYALGRELLSESWVELPKAQTAALAKLKLPTGAALT